MLELTIGSRFYYKNHFCEVKEGSCSENICILDGTKNCSKLKCESTNRHDKKDVYYSKVDEEYNLLDSIGKTEDLLPDNQPIKYDGTDYLTNKIIKTIQYIKNIPVHNFKTESYFGFHSLIIGDGTNGIYINSNDTILFDKNNKTMKIFNIIN